MEFREGDVVEYAGVEGIVTGRKNALDQFEVCFSPKDTENKYMCFDSDGRLHGWESKPALTFIKRPKFKREITVWAFIKPDGRIGSVYNTEESALKDAGNWYNSDCVLITTKGEVEI